MVNASPSISGRYPNLGPEVIVANDIVLIDAVDGDVFKNVKDGSKIRLHEGEIFNGEKSLVKGEEQDRGRDLRSDDRGQDRPGRSPGSVSRVTPSSSSAPKVLC